VSCGDPTEVRAFILAELRQRILDNGIDENLLTDDFDLRARGIIDSLGFVQLLGSLETRFGCAISLADVPVDRLTVIGVLCCHVAGQLPSASRGTL
jgi:acyl carrier protein